MGERELLVDNNQDNLTDGSKSASICSDQNGNLNGSITGNDIKACMASTAAARQPDLDYLTQLLKDKKQLAAFSNIFSHVERLLDDEINRVRVALFQCKFARDPLQLPEPVGETVLRQEKIFVPTKSHPDFNFVGRILGPRGMTAKQLESETGCKIMVRGKGSIRDKKKEDMNRGKANWEHLQEELHVLIQSEDTPNRNEVKIKRAVEEVNKLLVPSPEGEDELKKKQLMELAIINGTFRNGTPNGAAPAQSPSTVAALGQFAVAPGGFDQRLLSHQQNFNFSLTGLNGTVPGMVANSATLQSPALAGAPLIMQQATVSPQQQLALRSKADATQNGLLSISFGASPAAGGLANAQFAALAQAQAAALQLQQLQQGAGAQLMAANGVNGATFASQLPAATSAAANAAMAAQQHQQQQALQYQQFLLNSSQADPNAMAVQLAQLQQQQQQQQQFQQQQQQLAALMQVSCANGMSNFNAAGDQMAMMAALPYAALNDGCGTPTGGYGGAANNNSRSRRFIGQSRDHPYGKRE